MGCGQSTIKVLNTAATPAPAPALASAARAPAPTPETTEENAAAPDPQIRSAGLDPSRVEMMKTAVNSGPNQLNQAIQAAFAGEDHGQQAVLDRAMSDELDMKKVSPQELAKAVQRRLRSIREVRSLMERETKSQGDNVKPLAELDLDDGTIWMMLHLAHYITDELRTVREAGSNEALVVGIVAPAGGGKSTFAQVLKLLLRSSCCVEDAAPSPPRCEEVSLDDFLTSQRERVELGIPNRWELNATAEYFAETVLAKLKSGLIDGTVEVPCFSKGLDDRTDTVREVSGQVDIVLFEGWRIGVEHPNFFPFNHLVDTLIFLEVDFDAILDTKFECAQRDIEACGYDLYEIHGGYEHVFDRHYRRMYYDWILPVKGLADIVISKNANHQFCGLQVYPGRWTTARRTMEVEDTETVVVGAGQAGLCTAYYLQEAGSSYVVLEKAEAVGTSWTAKRWDSFRLVTENSMCMMPDFPCTEIGEDPCGFMRRDKITEYLQAFCQAKNLEVRLGHGAQAVTKGWQGAWIVQTTTGKWIRSRNVVMACSGFHVPKLAPFSKDLAPQIEQLHSSDYKRESNIPEGAVLVVGTGQSGTQIATELAEAGRRVFVCVGSRSLRVPRKVRGKDFTWWLHKTGLYDTKIDDLPSDAQNAKRFGPNPSQCPERDVSLRDLCHKYDLTLLGKAKGIADTDALQLESSTLQLNMTRIESNVQRMQLFIEQYVQKHSVDDPELSNLDPLELEPDIPVPSCELSPIQELSLREEGISTVIHCTGYQLNFQALLDLPDLYGEHNYPIQERGAATHHPGLFFLGLSWMYKWKSAVLCGIAEDAQHVVQLAMERSAKVFEGAPVPADRAGTLKGPPEQLTAKQAWQQTWNCHFDLIEDSSDRVFLREIGGTRKPLDYARLKRFIADDLNLHQFGITQGDRLCVIIPNGPEAAVCFLGMSLFCTYAPLSTKLTPEALKFEFEDLPAKAIVVWAGLLDTDDILKVANSCGNLPVIELVPSTKDVGLFKLQWRPSTARLSPHIAGRVWPTRDDVALVLHTSGTTNKPKVVPLSHGNISCGGLCISSTLGLSKSDICINIMPLFHIHGISVNVLVTALAGSSLYATTGFAGGEAFFQALQESPPPTWYSAVPTMHQEILNFAEEHKAKHGAAPHHHLKFARNCSAALLPSVGERMESVMGVEVLCTYAMTESMPIATNPRQGAQRKLRSVGFSGGPEILVMRDPEYNINTEVCRPNEEGHICVRGECVTLGYEKKGHMTEDPNIKAFTEKGFLCTGDKGFVDSDGHLVLSGRFKEIINRGGEKISPMEVEDVLITHPAIREMICFAMPHKMLGEVVGAAVVLHLGNTLELEKLRSFALKQGLQAKWLPETMILMSAIPKGSTGKPARIGLAAALQLPEMQEGDAPMCWDVADNSARQQVDPVSESDASDSALARTLHDSFLAVERSPVLVGSTTSVGLSRETWASTLLTYLMPALSNEIAGILGLPREDVSDEIPLGNLSFDSLSLMRFRQKLRDTIGVLVPLTTLIDHTITSLCNEIVAGRLASSAGPSSQLGEGESSEATDHIDASAPFELLPMQQLYWTGRSPLNGSPQPAWIEWETILQQLDSVRFETAVNVLTERHGSLRTFVLPDGKQQIEPAINLSKFRLTITNGNNDEATVELRNVLLSHVGLGQRPFQIEALRQPGGHTRIFFLFDLMVVDARSLTVLMDDLWQLYRHGETQLPNFALSLPQYVALDSERRKDVEQKRREDEFWSALCDQDPENGGLYPHPQLPLAVDQDSRHGHISRLSSSLDPDKWKQICKLCSAEGLTESSLVFACYISVLASWSSTKKFTMNAALFSRDTSLHAGVSELVGNLSSTMLVPVDVSLKAAPSLRTLAKTLQATVLSCMDHSVCTSGTDTMARLNKRDNMMGRAVAPFVFASVLNQEPADKTNPFTWFGKTPAHAALTTPQVWLDVQVFDDVDESFYFNWDFKANIFPEGLIITMFHAFCDMLEEIAQVADGPSPQRALGNRPILEPSQEQMVHRLNARAVNQNIKPLLMHQPILRQALATPHAIAVCDAATDQTFTFERILQLARSFAAAIVSAGHSGDAPTTKRPVPVYMKKGWQQVVGVLAVQLAGCPYVPISANQPPDRIAGILADISAIVLLHDGRIDIDELSESLACNGGQSAVRMIEVAEDAGEAHLPAVADNEGEVHLNDLAYIIFTSGSTGKPKGVMIPHSGGSNTCQDMNERFRVTAKDKVLSLAALSFDLSVYDIFGVMAIGGTLVMPDHQHKGDPEHWLHLLETQGITVWNTAPPVMTMLLDYVASSYEARERFMRLPLRLVLLSGDFIPLTMPTTLKQLLSEPDLLVCSLGGATEASIWSCYYPIDGVHQHWKSIPYGRALGNQKLYVLDENLQPVQDLVHGEICIAGDGLARGYWGDEEKTRKAFVHCVALDQRIYRTGDLGRYYPSGDVEILGRIDFQVKINGFRVEIGEVEAAINAVDDVVKSALAMPVGEKGMQQLAAFIVCTHPEAASDETKKTKVLDSVQKGLKSRVPSYAIPKYMILLKEFPMSVSGKVDRQALKQYLVEYLEHQQLQPGGAAALQHIEPRDDTETRLYRVWEAVLGFSGFGVMESFLDIGGTSIMLLRMAYKVKDEFGRSIPIDVLAGCSSIAALASWLQNTDTLEELTSALSAEVVALNPTGSMPPLFFVAPVSGISLCYRKLADALGAEQPIIALSHAQVCRDVEHASLEDIAAVLVKAVLEHLETLPEGRRDSFSVGGWSMGGVLAFEMLLQFRRMGKRLASIILVDSPAPAQGIRIIEDEAVALLQFANDLTSLDHTGQLPSSTQLAQSAEPQQDMLNALQQLLALPVELSVTEFSDMFSIYQRNLRALATYRPVVDDGTSGRVLLHLLRASETNEHLQAYPGHSFRDFGWGLINSSSPSLVLHVSLQIYQGDHYTVVRDSGAMSIGKMLGPLLANIGAHTQKQPERTNFHFVRRAMDSTGLARTTSKTTLSQVAPAPAPHVPKVDRTSFCVCNGTAKGDDNSVKCAQDAYGELVARSGRMPQLMLVSASQGIDPATAIQSLQLMAPDARIQAVSSIAGAICNSGLCTFGLLGISDPRGRIGLGYAEGVSQGQDEALQAGRDAAKQAMQDGLRADQPDIVIINGTPGHEEQVLAGVAEVVQGVPIIGGSAAGDVSSCSWWVASAHRERINVSNDGVSICMLWTSVEVATVFSSCYEPSAHGGTVTKAADREIVEIDGHPASAVYGDWIKADAADAGDKSTDGQQPSDRNQVELLQSLMQEDTATIGERLFMLSTCRPLGTHAAPLQEGETSKPFFQLMHPHLVTENGGVRLFADVHEGQKLTLMKTSRRDLVELVESATDAPLVSTFCETLQGALAFYCAGCSMQIREEIDDVAKNLSSGLNGKPFMGILPYGEQGTDEAGSVRHGNLMYSLLLFGKSKP